jgi:hypothetical protein
MAHPLALSVQHILLQFFCSKYSAERPPQDGSMRGSSFSRARQQQRCVRSPRNQMGKTAWQNLLSATKCHKFNFAFASPISCIILIAVAALTGVTRNYFSNIVTKIAGNL